MTTTAPKLLESSPARGIAVRQRGAQPTRRTSTRLEIIRVKEAIEQICDQMQPGEQVPSHSHFMRSLNASTSVVLDALNQLQRSGRIIRRAGAGTFIPTRSDNAHATETRPIGTDSGLHTIIVIAPPDNGFFAHFGSLMLRRSQAYGLKVVFHPTLAESVADYVVDRPCGSGEVYLCMSSSFLPLAERLADQGHRVVAIADPSLLGRQPIVPCIHADNVQGGYIAANHLIELGHRRISYPMDTEQHAVGSRWEGIRLAISDANHAGIDVKYVPLYGDVFDSWIAVPNSAVEYFNRSDGATGLCVWNDRTAMKMINILSRAGVSVPRDVSIVGYDNLPDDVSMSPQLTTMDQGVDQQIRLALQLLTQPEAPSVAHTIVVTPTLIVRESTSAPSHFAKDQSK